MASSAEISQANLLALALATMRRSKGSRVHFSSRAALAMVAKGISQCTFKPGRALCASCPGSAYNSGRKKMAKAKERIFEVACPDCAAMLKIDAATGLLVSHTPAPRKRMFEDLETAAQAMREQDERKESIFRQSVEAEKNKEDLFEKKFAEALRKAKDAPDGKPLREFDLD